MVQWYGALWLHFHVIPIPKRNTSPVTYRPIALSSVLCKIVKYVIKNRLGWYLEKKNVSRTIFLASVDILVLYNASVGV